MMESLFLPEIDGWASWSRVFQSKDAFSPLIRHIFEVEKLPFTAVENLTPGTNAVFKIGGTAIKIFAPRESGMDAYSDYKTELFGLKRADKLDIPAPRVLASGCIHDKYDFLYIVTGFIDDCELCKVEEELTGSEKERIGWELREIANRMNTRCERFNQIDVVGRAVSAKQWSLFPESFIRERLLWLERFEKEDEVFVHGDLNPDNILVDSERRLYIIDFADSVLAPAEYELAALVCETFDFERPYMEGFFGENYCAEQIAEKCFRALLIHDFGEGIIKNNFGKPEEITSLKLLYERIHTAILRGKGF